MSEPQKQQLQGALETTRSLLGVFLMENIANNSLDYQEEINRLVSQTKALLLTLTAQDQFKTLHEQTIADALWLLTDRLSDIETTCGNMFKEASS